MSLIFNTRGHPRILHTHITDIVNCNNGYGAAIISLYTTIEQYYKNKTKQLYILLIH